MHFEVGNKVKFLNENLTGVVKAILKNDMLLIEASDGFEHKVSPNQVLVYHEDNSITYNVNKAEIKSKLSNPFYSKPSSSILARYESNTKFQYEKVLEIDLHLEELVEFPMRLDDRLRLHTQIQHAKKCLDAAIQQKCRKIVFIHGVGQGILKTELRNFLGAYENITVNDADYKEYGSGATEVNIK